MTLATNRDSLWRIAVHEAGHLVVAYILGIGLDEVVRLQEAHARQCVAGELLRDYASADELVAVRRCDDLNDEVFVASRIATITENLQISLAGMVAEELFFGSTSDLSSVDAEAIQICLAAACHADSDELRHRTVDVPRGATLHEWLILAEQKYATLPKCEADHFRSWALQRTTKLLRARKSVVEAVAEKLMAKEQLSDRAVESIIEVSTRAMHRKASRRLPPNPTTSDSTIPRTIGFQTPSGG